jgi:RNA polymerase sigma factor (TIGR02999 family)
MYNLPFSVKDQMPNTHEITELLQAWSRGDSDALDRLIPLVDHELKKIAHAYMRKERPVHILQTTALVDEALLRLIRAEKINWDNRKQFYGLIAYRMRQILVEYARRQITGGGTRIAQVGVSEAEKLTVKASEQLLRLHQALTKLETRDARKAKVVELRYFGGYTFDEIAEMLEVSKTMAERDWHFARKWLKCEIDGDETVKSSET